MSKATLFILFLLIQANVQAKNIEDKFRLRPEMAFIENKGQITDPYGNPRNDIDFVLPCGNMVVYIGQGKLHYQFMKQQPPAREGTPPLPSAVPGQPNRYMAGGNIVTCRLDMSLKGVVDNSAIEKSAPRKTVYHYYTGSKGDNGVTQVHCYQKIVYRSIYPNIDWVLYTSGNGLKYDFIVHPGGQVSDIQMVYEGASAIKLLKNGDLSVSTPLGQVQEKAPHAYERETGKVVNSHFSISENNVYFQTDQYQGTLVIDPGVAWATYFGGAEDEYPSGITTDSHGNIYICGTTISSSGIATLGSHQDTLSLLMDGFLAKFDSLGQLQWATYYGGGGTTSPVSGYDLATGVTCDSFGHVYLVGSTLSEDGIATVGSYQDTISPLPDMLNSMNGFLVQFNSNGVRKWGTYYGASAQITRFYSVACDNKGNVYVGGQADSTSSTTGALVPGNAFQPQCAGGWDGLLVKFDSSGNREWATYYGGQSHDEIYAVACDNNGVYIGGGTAMGSTSGISTSNGYLTSVPSTNMNLGFIAKFDTAGNRVWGSYIHGSVRGLALYDSSLYVGGPYASGGGVAGDTTITTPGCWQSTFYDGAAYLMSFNARTCTRNWGTYYGEQTYGRGVIDVAVNNEGSVFLSGSTISYDNMNLRLIATQGSHQDTLNASPGLDPPPSDMFLAQFDSTGQRQWGSYFGGAEEDQSAMHSLSCGPFGAIYMLGGTQSNSAISTAGAYQGTLAGDEDAFLVRWLPLDISLDVFVPYSDTVCTGLVPFSVQVNNQGRIDKTDTLKIGYTYSGMVTGAADTFYTNDILVGETDTFQLPELNFPVPGSYNITVFLYYTQDDNNIDNDTLHFSVTATNAEPVADIQVNQLGSQYYFSNPSGLPSDNYYWDFGDGDTSTASNPSHEYAATDSYLVTLVVTGYCGSDTATQTIYAIGASGISIPASGSDHVTLYPNPAQQILFIRASDDIRIEAYTITNVLGQKVLSGKVKPGAGINIRSLASGSYFIQIRTNNGITNKQFKVLRK